MIEERCGANASQGAALQVSLKQGRGAGVRGQARRGRGSKNGLPPASASEARGGRVPGSSAGAGESACDIRRGRCLWAARAMCHGNDMNAQEIRFRNGRRTSGTWDSGASWRGAPSSGGSTRHPAPGGWVLAGGMGFFWEVVRGGGGRGWMHGVDPSLELLAYARARLGLEAAEFRDGDARALPYPDDAFDVAVMPLVIFFVPDPARGVAEMARVVRPGGAVAAYAWDMVGGGFPYEGLLAEIRALGIAVPAPPSPEASRIDVLRDLWAGAGLEAIETREIEVSRTFSDFDDFWVTALGAPSVGSTLAAMAGEDVALLKVRMGVALPSNAAGHIMCRARANAVKGRVLD